MDLNYYFIPIYIGAELKPPEKAEEKKKNQNIAQCRAVRANRSDLSKQTVTQPWSSLEIICIASCRAWNHNSSAMFSFFRLGVAWRKRAATRRGNFSRSRDNYFRRAEKKKSRLERGRRLTHVLHQCWVCFGRFLLRFVAVLPGTATFPPPINISERVFGRVKKFRDMPLFGRSAKAIWVN